MSETLSIGMIGLDSSRSVAFAELINTPGACERLPVMRVDMVCPGPVSHSASDADRASRHADELVQRWGAELVAQPEAVVDRCGLIMLLSADANDRCAVFDRVVASGRPMFIEKLLAESSRVAQAMIDRASASGSRLFSASSVRYSPGWRRLLASVKRDGAPDAIELSGPMPVHETLPIPLWYGVHLVDLAIDVMGADWSDMERTGIDGGEVTHVRWPDGRRASLRGYYQSESVFKAVVHRENSLEAYDLEYQPGICNTGLLEAVVGRLTQTKAEDNESGHMLDAVRLVEAMVSVDPLSKEAV